MVASGRVLVAATCRWRGSAHPYWHATWYCRWLCSNYMLLYIDPLFLFVWAIHADDVIAAPPAVLSDADVRAYLRAGVGAGKARKHHDLYERACVNRAVRCNG